MIKLDFHYDQNSVRLTIEGLPDKSLGQSSENIGILSSWQLELIGMPTLEGKREHLESLMAVVFPYARYYLSGLLKTFGDSDSTVQIFPDSAGHKLVLKSTKEGVAPLKLRLDDAQLADLTRCLDDLLQDEKVIIPWNIPEYKSLSKKNITEREPIVEKLVAPFLGISAVICFSFMYLSLPIPKSNIIPENQPKVQINK